MLDEKSCLTAVRRGDEAAAKRLVEHLYPVVVRVVTGRLPRTMTVEDMAQEVFGKMFQKLDQYQGHVPLGHWVSRIALTTCFDALRRQNRRPEIRFADLTEEEEAVVRELERGHGTEEDLDAASAMEVVEKMLSSLSPEDAAVIRWMELEDKTIKDIQQLTGWSVALVKIRAFRARRKLRQIYEKMVTEGENR